MPMAKGGAEKHPGTLEPGDDLLLGGFDTSEDRLLMKPRRRLPCSRGIPAPRPDPAAGRVSPVNATPESQWAS